MKNTVVSIKNLLKQFPVGGDFFTALKDVNLQLNEGEFLGLDNTVHPVTSSLNFASALKHFINIFGIHWEDNSGTNNAHFAPFVWEGETA